MRTVQNKLLALVAVISAMFTYGAYSQVMSESCSYDIFPVFIGGTKGHEKVSCFAYDAANDIIMIGGNTTSEDFAPASNEHGFLMAIDSAGNYKWGNFFYNVSYALSDIQGCVMSKDGKSLNLQGLGNSQPVLMSVNPPDGFINTYLSVEYYNRSEDLVPDYGIAGAVFEEEADVFDGQNYFYTAFTINDTMQMMRIRVNGDTPEIDWNQEIVDIDTTTQADDQIRRKDASFIHPDPEDDQLLYMTGRLRGYGSVVKFQKRDAVVRWWAEFTYLTKIYAYAHGKNDGQLYVCGDYQPNEAAATPDTAPYVDVKYTAGIAKMSRDGDVNWFKTFAGQHPSQNEANSVYDQDRCRGLAYNEDDNTLGIIIQTKASDVRTNTYPNNGQQYPGNYYDTLLIKLDRQGSVDDVVLIYQGDLEYDMYSAQQALFLHNDYYYFSGWSYGFKTNYNELQADTTSPKYDAYIYKYQFERDYYKCLYRYEPTASTVENLITTYGRSDNVINVRKRGSEMFAYKRRKDYFYPYISRYSGGFVLQDTFRIPRPCAYKSTNMTAVDYYRGQKPLTYDIFRENAATAVTLMTGGVLQYQTGESCDDIATLDKTKNTVIIQTDAENKVGVQQVLIRDCDVLNRLLEANLYINVLSNNYPDFVTEPTTSWTMAEGDVVTYRLPNVVDPEGNDEPEVYVDIMDAQEDKYPPFLMFENSTNTLIFKPNSKWVRGKQYYFTIVVKEKNSDSVKYSFYCTVRITGEVVEVPPEEKIQITYKLTEVDLDGRGSIYFDTPVNMTYLEENFGDVFDVFWRDTEWKQNQLDRDLTGFDVENWGKADNQSIDFKLEFAKPYQIGLLLKRSDKLFVRIKEGVNATEFFITNSSITTLENNEAQIRLEMIFDWDNPNMATMRTIAKNMYWVLISIIVLQFILLTLRKVGLLPVWVFIEYLQLVGFMPIYNFRLIPYLYDAFKPSLVSHMIIFDETPGLPEMDKEYFNDNYEYYWLSTGRMAQSFAFIILFLIIILISNLVVFIIYKTSGGNSGLHGWAEKKLVQFKYNVYIRFYMLAYFDLTFFSIMKIMDENNSTTTRKAMLLLSYITFVLSIIIPVFLIAHINRRFEVLSLKQAKQSFNTLLLKIDKGSRWRVMNPAYFFARRALTAMLLTLPIDNTFIFLQYVFILMSSHAYILYMVACKPYQTPGINSYVLANETFYSALIIAIFIFSDATPEKSIKYGAGVALIVSLILLVVSNIVMNIVYLVQGPNTIKKAIKEANLKRAEKEALERAEEEERKLKKKKEEEEFTKIPDDTINVSGMEPGAGNANMGSVDEKKSKKKKGGKKKKGQEDEVVNGMGSDDFQQREKAEKRRKGDKEKNKTDDVTESNVPGRSKRRKTTNPDTIHGTDYPTAGTKGDML